MKRTCSGCQQSKPFTAKHFRKANDRKSGLKGICVVCDRKYSARYRTDNREMYRKSGRKWAKSPRGIYCYLNSKGKRVPGIKKCSLEEFIEWYESQELRCVYCGTTQDELANSTDKLNASKTRLTIDQKIARQGYFPENMCLACSRCSMVKSDIFSQEETKEIATKYLVGRT